HGQTFTEDWLTRPCCEQYERPICPKRTSLKRLRRNGQRWRNGPSKSGDSPGASYASSCCFWSVMNISGRCHRGIRSVLRTAVHCASAARFCDAPSGVLNKDALAIVDVVDAVILAHLVAMGAVVPARIVERLCFCAIRASLRLWCLV